MILNKIDYIFSIVVSIRVPSSIVDQTNLSSELSTMSATVVEVVPKILKLIVIVSDWVMPLKNGDVLAKYVKSLDQSVKVVVLSGKLEESKVESYITSNTIDKVIMKPWDEAYLMEVIKNEIA